MPIKLGASGDQAELPFAIYDSDNLPVVGHSFSAGQVKLRTPGGVFVNANTSNIVECGHGQYVLQLTSAQTSAEGPVLLYFTDGVHRDYSNYEMIADSVDDLRSVPFSIYEPDGDGITDGVEGFAFSPGDVEIRLPGQTSFASADIANIEEYGMGQYGLVLTAAQRAQPGAVMVYFSDGVNRDYFGYELNATAASVSAGIIATPVSVTASASTMSAFNHVKVMLSRLPEYARKEVT